MSGFGDEVRCYRGAALDEQLIVQRHLVAVRADGSAVVATADPIECPGCHVASMLLIVRDGVKLCSSCAAKAKASHG